MALLKTPFLLFYFFILNFFPLQCYAFDLSAFFSRVEERDYQLKNLLHREKAGEYRVYQAKSAYFPKIDVSSYLGWEKYKLYYGDEISKSLRYYYLSLRQPVIHLELLAKIKESKLANEVDALRTSQQRYYARYYALTTLIHYLTASSREKILLQLLEVEKERLVRAEQLLKAKVISEDEYIAIQKDYHDALVSHEQVLSDLNVFSFILKELVGNFTLPNSLCITSDFVNVTKELLPSLLSLESLLENNFEVRIAKKNIEVASAEYDIRKYERFPKLDFTLVYWYSTSTGTSYVKEDFRAALSLEFPIFQGGYFSARKAEALELKKAAEAVLLDTFRHVRFQFQQSLKRYQQSLKKFHSFRERLLSDEHLLNLYQKAYLTRAKSIFDVLFQKSEVLKDQDALLQSLDDLLTSYVELYYLSAELEPENLDLLNLIWPSYCHAKKISFRICKKRSY